MIFNAFHNELKTDVQKVVNILTAASIGNVSMNFSKETTEYNVNGKIIKIPYRFYLLEPSEYTINLLTKTQKMILYCLYTRSCDGYLREKYIKKLLDLNFKEWVIPYIVKLCDEYVYEIIELIYEKLKLRDNGDIKKFCLNNAEIMYKSYSRMTSYWNAYYRLKAPDINNYVGKLLFKKCFGVSESFKLKNNTQNRSNQ